MDSPLDAQIAAAGESHYRRRRRSRRIFGAVEHVFYLALLVGAIGLFLKFIDVIWPHVP